MTTGELQSRALGVKMDKIKSSGFIYRLQRQLSFLISLTLTKFLPWVRPNAVSISSVFLVLASIALNSLYFDSVRYDGVYVFFCQLAILFLSSVFDKVDGELARIQNYFTQRGIYYDILYHLIYPLGLYLSAGFFFFSLSGDYKIIIFTLILAILITSHKMTGKLRHHIKYKITLEDNKNTIADFGRSRSSFTQSKIIKPFYYLVFMIYDWVWVWFGLLALLSLFEPGLAGSVYLMYVAFAIFYVGEELFYRYPKESLFLFEEVN